MSATRDLTALLEQTGWIHALARKLVADPHLAADLAQETCVQALERAPTAEQPLRAWLATVLRRQLARVRRGNANRAEREGQRRGQDAPGTAEIVERAETHKNVVLAVLALPEPYRSTLLMRFFEQLSYDEIARRTGLTSAAVNSRVTRGLAELRARLETTYGGDRRALGLALIPLAKLPTSGLALTTATGWKTMTFWIGSAAAGLIVTTLSVATFGGGGRGAGRPANEPVVREELEVPLALVPEGAAGRVEAPLTLPVAPQQHQKTRGAPWETNLAQTLVLAPSVVSYEVNSGAGNVEVRPSRSGRVEIDAHVVAQLDKVKPERLTQVFEDHVEISEKKGVLRIKDRHDNEQGWSVHLVVSVPKALPVHANSGAGDVLVAAGAKDVQANSGAGEVRIELADARLEFLRANSGAGDVAVAVGALTDKLELNSGAGAVTLLVADPASPGKGDLNSGAGDVRLLVPANWVGELDLETMGAIELPPSFGLSVERDISGRSSARGMLGAGGGSYTLRSGAGSLGVAIGHALPERKPKKH